jgi:hypothetical protein
MFWMVLFLFIGFTVLSELLRPKAKLGSPQPGALGDFQVPTAEEGRQIPTLWGTCNVKGPNVVWYGDLAVVPITHKVKTGMFSSVTQTTGFRYYLGAQLALCHGAVDELVEVRFDDRPVPTGKVTINVSNDGIVFGLVADFGVFYVAHMAHGNYTNLFALALEAQRAMRATYGSDWRVVYGFEVRYGISDQFVYQVQDDGLSFGPDTTVELQPAQYDGPGYAAALAAGINAAEALVAGGPRIHAAVTYTGSRFRIVFTAARPGWRAWNLRTYSIDNDRTTAPTLGARMAFDVLTLLGDSYESQFAVSETRYSWAHPSTGAKLAPTDTRFTSYATFGFDRNAPGITQVSRPDVDVAVSEWGLIGGSGGSNPQSAALADGSDASYIVAGTDTEISSGDLSLFHLGKWHMEALSDPGATTGYSIHLRLRRHGLPSDGLIRVTAELRPFGGTSGVISVTADANVDEAWHDFTLDVLPTQVTLFRIAGGFANFELWLKAEYLGLPALGALRNTIRISGASFQTPAPGYLILQNARTDQDRQLYGVAYHDAGDYFRIDVDQPTLFGGETGEGGVTGRIDLYKGTETQTANDYLTGLLGPLPAYRGMSYAVLRRLYVGTSPYLRTIGFVLKRCPNTLGLAGGHHDIAGDANPAAMLYEILTNDRWGLGIPGGQIDVAAFRSVGDVLATEGLGLSMLVDNASTAADLILEITRHLDAVLFTDPATGLVTLTLVRASYGAGDPVRLDRSNVQTCRLSRPAWDDTFNSVKVLYIDRAGNFAERIAQAQDLANVQIRGGDIAEEQYDFRGFSNATNAQLTAARVLKTVAYPLAVLELYVNRVAWALRPGGLARLTWEALGITDMVIRITRISTGTLTDGMIRIDAVEDVFGVAATAYTAPAASAWVDPVTAPAGLVAAALVEAPYALVVGPARVVLTLGAQADQVQSGYQVWASIDGTPAYAEVVEVRDMTPSGLLSRQAGYSDDVLIVAGPLALLTSASDVELAGGVNVALIDDEFIAWQYIASNGDGTYTLTGVVRGVADTTPAPHVAGARVWFVTFGAGFTSADSYVDDVTVRAKLLAFTPLGVQAADDVDEVTVTTRSRSLRPYVPAGITVNGLAYPVLIDAGDITVAWQHRNRLADWSWANAGVLATPEPGTTYTLRFYDEADVVRRVYAELTGTSQAWTDEVSDCGHRNERVRIELEAVVDGLVSFQIFNVTLWRSMAEQATPVTVTRVRRRPASRVFVTSE